MTMIFGYFLFAITVAKPDDCNKTLNVWKTHYEQYNLAKGCYYKKNKAKPKCAAFKSVVEKSLQAALKTCGPKKACGFVGTQAVIAMNNYNTCVTDCVDAYPEKAKLNIYEYSANCYRTCEPNYLNRVRYEELVAAKVCKTPYNTLAAGTEL
eukprot:NODE_522_length_7276_cov_0.315173.p4 type:complete len:152 gc:universal NODE_522_length_7276_cov_0.315173:6996-6541(-)